MEMCRQIHCSIFSFLPLFISLSSHCNLSQVKIKNKQQHKKKQNKKKKQKKTKKKQNSNNK